MQKNLVAAVKLSLGQRDYDYMNYLNQTMCWPDYGRILLSLDCFQTASMKVYKGIKYADAARFAKPLQAAGEFFDT